MALSGTFTGTTPQGKKCGRSFNSRCSIVIRIASNKVKPSSDVKWIATCSTGKVLSGSTSMHGPLKRQKFRAHGTYTAAGLGTTTSGAPISARETVTIVFTLHGRHATGSVTANATVVAQSAVIDHCKTGKVHFSAKR
jgi:hypothetical protein